jgi:hypothetical protein
MAELSNQDVARLFGRGSGPAWWEPLWETPKRELNRDIDLLIAGLEALAFEYAVSFDCAIDIWKLRERDHWAEWKEQYIVWCARHGIEWPSVLDESAWQMGEAA